MLIGEGTEENRIRQLAKNQGLDNMIIFYGTSKRVAELFQAMDVFVLPSHFEGLPIAGVEAQAAGLPVLFSNQITQEAKLTMNVAYLDITESSVDKWVDQVKTYSKYERHDAYQDLKERKFSIQDTINSFLELYR